MLILRFCDPDRYRRGSRIADLRSGKKFKLIHPQFVVMTAVNIDRSIPLRLWANEAVFPQCHRPINDPVT